MRPLEITRVEEEEEDEGDYDENDLENGTQVQRNQHPRRTKPLLLRMAEEKRNYLERGSLAGEDAHILIPALDRYTTVSLLVVACYEAA